MISPAKIESWADKHHPRWIDILRILLGLILLAKGVSFAINNNELYRLLEQSRWEWFVFLVVHYVIVLHIVGGFLIAIGLAIRIWSLLQLPILIGAVFFINIPKGFIAINSELGFSILILFLLLFFLIYGSGPLSVDHYITAHKSK